jgi:hypothetical protein
MSSGNALESGLTLAATIEGCVTPRLSIRGDIGAGWIGRDRGGFRNELRAPYFNVNLAYNWDRGVLRPYVTGGLGWYRYTSVILSGALLDPAARNDLIALGLEPALLAGMIERSDNRLGANIGGGLEYPLSPRATIVGDLRYHVVGDVAGIAPFEGSFLNLSVGVKRYF